MFKLGFLLLAMVSIAAARPAVVAAPVAYTGLPVASPVAYTAPGFVTATSSQYFARNYNGVVAAPYVAAAAAPLVAAPAAPLVAAPTARLVASSAYSYAPAFVF